MLESVAVVQRALGRRFVDLDGRLILSLALASVQALQDEEMLRVDPPG